MAPIPTASPEVVTTSPTLVWSNSSHDSSSAAGVPFGTALAVALAATVALIVVPVLSYAVLSCLIRRCRRRRRRHARVVVMGQAGPCPSTVGLSEPGVAVVVGDHGLAGSDATAAACPMVPCAKGLSAEREPAPQLLSFMVPRRWKKTKQSGGIVSSGCEKSTVRGNVAIEEKENIFSALVGFLRSWARVEGDGRS